jgi:hypothetical protein
MSEQSRYLKISGKNVFRSECSAAAQYRYRYLYKITLGARTTQVGTGTVPVTLINILYLCSVVYLELLGLLYRYTTKLSGKAVWRSGLISLPIRLTFIPNPGSYTESVCKTKLFSDLSSHGLNKLIKFGITNYVENLKIIVPVIYFIII